MSGFVLEAHADDGAVADAFRRALEHHPGVSVWAFDEYRECSGCGEDKRLVQGGCCRGCAERTLRGAGPACETSGCDRDAEIHRVPKAGRIPTDEKLCGPCFEAWKSGAHTTGPGRYETRSIP